MKVFQFGNEVLEIGYDCAALTTLDVDGVVGWTKVEISWTEDKVLKKIKVEGYGLAVLSEG